MKLKDAMIRACIKYNYPDTLSQLGKVEYLYPPGCGTPVCRKKREK